MTRARPANEEKSRRLSPGIAAIRGVLVAAMATTGLFAASVRAAEKVTHLFTSWYGIDAGNTVFTVNRNNVDPESLAILEQVKDFYQKTLALTDTDLAPERIAVPTGVRLRAEVAKKTEPWLIADKPWESGVVAVQRVIHVDGLYRVWYTAAEKGGQETVVISPATGKKKLASDGETFAGICYMESRDARTWVKPSLGLVEYRGSKDNNIVTQDVRVGVAIFLDPFAPPSERYKTTKLLSMTVFDPNSKVRGPVLAGAVSPDGLRWTPLPEPLWKEVFNSDGGTEIHVDPLTGKYVLYMRANYPRRRSIARAETRDFRRWPDPVMMLTPGGPDDDPSADYYSNPYVFYPGSSSSHLMLVSAYHRDVDRVDVHLASSMDGDGWNWLSPRTVIELGPLGAWDGGMLWAASDMVRLPDGRVAVGVFGQSERHNEYWRLKFERGKTKESGVCWATWEDGRIAGIEAEKAGEFTTLPLKSNGSPIEVNARVGASGSVDVTVLVEEQGDPFPKFALKAAQMTGDRGWQQLTFPQGSLASLAGQNLRLQFRLFNAKVFGIRGEGLEWARPGSRGGLRETATAAAARPPPAAGADSAAQPAPLDRLEVAAQVAFLEGPTCDSEGRVYFSDVRNERILCLAPDGTWSTYRERSGGANGNVIDSRGRLVTCEGRAKRVTRTDLKTGRIEVLAEHSDALPLQGPNDVTFDGQGRLYFSDPGEPGAGSVFRIDLNGKVTRILRSPDIEKPNGLIVAPDDGTLYVVESNWARGGSRLVRAFDLSADGVPSNMRVIRNFYPGRSMDGISVDSAGNIYGAGGLSRVPDGATVTLDTRAGIHVFAPDGKPIRFIPVPEDSVTNCCFGGPDLKTLYITAGKTLFRTRVDIPGTRR